MAFLAGPFELYINPYAEVGAVAGAGALALGKTRDGIEVEITHAMQEVAGDDLGQETIQDYILAGGNCFLNFTLLEWNATGVAYLRKMYTAQGGGGSEGSMGSIGCRASDYAFPLGWALISTSACPTNITPYIYHAEYAALPPNSPLRYSLSSRLRELPIRLQLFPADHSGYARAMSIGGNTATGSTYALGGSSRAWFVAPPSNITHYVNWP